MSCTIIYYARTTLSFRIKNNIGRKDGIRAVNKDPFPVVYLVIMVNKQTFHPTELLTGSAVRRFFKVEVTKTSHATITRYGDVVQDVAWLSASAGLG